MLDTATRELEEETGISAETVTVVTPEPIQVHAHTTPVRYTTRGQAHYHFDCRFVVRTSADVGPLRATEVGRADWFTPDRLPDDVLRSRVLNLTSA